MIDKLYYDEGDQPTEFDLEPGQTAYNIWDETVYLRGKYSEILTLFPNSAITNINSDITNINSDITNINSDITNINSDITNIQQGGYYTIDNGFDVDITNESIWGDTNVAVEREFISCSRVGNVASIAMDIELIGFSKAFPTDLGFAFDFNLARIADSEGWFKTISRANGIFNVEVFPGDSSFSSGRVYDVSGLIRFKMGETAQGSTAMTATSAYVHGVAILIVGD